MVKRRGFTVLELLTTISIIVLLIALSVPALRQARRFSRRILNMNNQHSVLQSVTLYACDNSGDYPPSVALCRLGGSNYRWQDPRKIVTTQPLPRMEHNSVAGYLKDYLNDADTLFCPSSPEPYPYWQEAWTQADTWDHPDTQDQGDPIFGTYALYWNYIAYRPDEPSLPFRGPIHDTGAPGHSTLLISDYFGADEWRARGSYGSCEPIPRADITEGSEFATAYWSQKHNGNLEDRSNLNLRLHAGYVDGHIESYNAQDTTQLEAAETADGQRPYWRGDTRWPGYFFIPNKAITKY